MKTIETMGKKKISECTELMQIIQDYGFLPLLESGVDGFSADAMVDDDCRYTSTPDGGWDWPMWKWKGPIITNGDCVYGKFFNKKAGFVSKEWWPDLYNYRRSKSAEPEVDSIEETIIETLRNEGSLITRDLRAACGFDGPKMRSKFDSYITKMQMDCRIVTEDFVYPTDKHGKEYGWGWALLSTPENLYGLSKCKCQRTPAESGERIRQHLTNLLPQASKKQILKLLG